MDGLIFYLIPPLFEQYVLGHLRTFILCAWANQAVVRILLKHVSGPTGDTAACENGCIQVDGEAHHIVHRGRIEIDIAVEALMFFDIFLNNTRHLIPAAVTRAFAQLLGHHPQMRSARILSAVYAVTKT